MSKAKAPPSNQDWARAFARQAKADFDSWNALGKTAPALPQCQKLHFLQMACEKLGKAHVWKSGVIPGDIFSSHAFIAKQIPAIVRQVLVETTGKSPKARDFIVKHSRHIAREIELLSPSVDDGGRRPENCEYPWVDRGNTLHVPCESSFAPSRLVIDEAGRTFLKIIARAIDNLIT